MQQQQAPEGLAKDIAAFDKKPGSARRLIEAYGLGILHGREMAGAEATADKERDEKPA
jgi:hypothetical protein